MPRLRLASLLVLAAAVGACASTTEEEVLQIDVYVQNAQGYMDGGHYEQALAQFRRALRIDADHGKARLGEAFCLYHMGDRPQPGAEVRIQEAEAAFAALDPSDYGENSWKVALGRGMVHSRLSELYDAAARLRDPGGAAGDRGAPADRERALAESRRHASLAEAAFRAVLADGTQPLARDNLTALFFLARAGALRATRPEEYDEALAFFRRYEVQVDRSKALWRSLAKSEPENAAVLEQRLRAAERQEIALRDTIANILFKRRDHAGSLAELDKVLALDGDRASAWLARGQNNEALGRFGAAADDYRRFLALTDNAPSSEDVIRATERMRACEARSE